ncbi:patatin-like protein 6 [Elaeis guineensis]|uniref:Patatin-like protein 6 n=1 Tax=Elaeis guineensis var. tenera TaxID=51953 RepID=A0A6I9SDN5_ELAGV|nr:patatin-like protein 6 [Elaeis guineensis]
MESAVAWMEPSLDLDKLSHEVFSILENKFRFGSDEPNPFLAAESPPATLPNASAAESVRILSIDGGGSASDGLLSRIKAFLRKLSGDPTSRIADFFDLATRSGAGGVLVAMLFVPGPNGRSPVFSADEAHCLLPRNRSRLATSNEQGFLRKIFQRFGGGGGVFFRRIFGDATPRDTVKPVVIPCYDPVSGAPFVFPRADAVETNGYDFLMRQVCDATSAAPGAAAVGTRSLDGHSRVRAVGGVLAMRNPTEAVGTHILNNKLEFPFATGAQDLLVLAQDAGEPEPAGRTPAPPSAANLVRLAGMGRQADVVAEAMAMAFGKNRTTNYIRVQGNGDSWGPAVDGVEPAEETLAARNVEPVLFGGRKLTERTNGDKLEWVTEELIRQHDWRTSSKVPTVLINPTMTPGASCSTTVSTMYSASP